MDRFLLLHVYTYANILRSGKVENPKLKSVESNIEWI